MRPGRKQTCWPSIAGERQVDAIIQSCAALLGASMSGGMSSGMSRNSTGNVFGTLKNSTGNGVMVSPHGVKGRLEFDSGRRSRRSRRRNRHDLDVVDGVFYLGVNPVTALDLR